MFKFFERILHRRSRTDRQQMVDELRSKGAIIGEDLYIYAPNETIIDMTSPFLLTIGDHVRITSGVKILTHDYSWSAAKGYTPENGLPGAILGAQSPVEIGSHVFIGMNAIITRGVKIGDHVIVGAGSVVTKDCESNSVYAGNPARRICSMEAFCQKRKALQFAEAKEIAIRYRSRFGKVPPVEVFNEYFQLFLTRQQAEENPAFKAQMERMGGFEQTQEYMDANPPMFDGYEAFLSACYAEDDTSVEQYAGVQKA